MKEMVGGCCVCSDERGWPDNPLVYCDGNGCTVAVHQACYGIVTVPTGPWYCRKCESPDNKGKVKCELCPSKSGALKRSDTGGWAHVVCALYIPEVRFGNVTSMEPIVLRLIPPERFNKTCYICQDNGKSHRASAGACMQCNKSGCKQQFHVTCAQSLGLLCEEAGNYLDNVKYCGYCQHHYSKLKKGGNVKTIPPYKPVAHDSQSSDSSGEKEGEGSSPKSGPSTSHSSKSKTSNRKSSHSSTSSSSSKSTPSSSKTPTSSSQSTDKGRKSSPSRRSSTAGESPAGGSKGNTPAPSPQHLTETPPPPNNINKGGTTPNSSSTSKPTVSSPVAATAKPPPEPVGVINSAPPASVANTTHTVTSPTTSTIVTQSVVLPPKPFVYDDSESKQTKKRKAINAANSNSPLDYAATTSVVVETPNQRSSYWEGANQAPTEIPIEAEKIIKKAKTDASEMMPAPPAHYSNPGLLPPPPPPPRSPSTTPSPRHIPSPLPGPSGLHQAGPVRSPLMQTAAMEQTAPSHPPHSVPGRSNWGGLNVAYEMQQPDIKPGTSNQSKDPANNLGSVAIRNKKRAAMSTVVSMPAPNVPPMQSTIQSLANVRRQPQATPPPSAYQETIKDSPPISPGSDKPLKPKLEHRLMPNCSAPHMLGNELNPDSGAAARLQEQLSAELAAHAAGSAGQSSLIPPPLINKASQGCSTSPRGSTSSAQSLDQLLERQWEQGSQFLMEQAQHFDIASLLSCLHQLRTENVRLEEHVGNLLQRRDHLLAVNARLAIPLTSAQAGPPEPGRCPRENGTVQGRAPSVAGRSDGMQPERSHHVNQQVMVRDVQPKPS